MPFCFCRSFLFSKNKVPSKHVHNVFSSAIHPIDTTIIKRPKGQNQKGIIKGNCNNWNFFLNHGFTLFMIFKNPYNM